MPTFKGQCDTCARPLMGPDAGQSGAAGYASDQLARRHCYQCCADYDQAYMRAKGKIMLYLVNTEAGALSGGSKNYRITNWPGTLEFSTAYMRRGYHNIAGRRYDVWFYFAGKRWHGVQYGDNTQILHCRQTKTA